MKFKTIECEIRWVSNHLNSRFSSYRFIIVENFRHRLARSICYNLFCKWNQPEKCNQPAGFCTPMCVLLPTPSTTFLGIGSGWHLGSLPATFGRDSGALERTSVQLNLEKSMKTWKTETWKTASFNQMWTHEFAIVCKFLAWFSKIFLAAFFLAQAQKRKTPGVSFSEWCEVSHWGDVSEKTNQFQLVVLISVVLLLCQMVFIGRKLKRKTFGLGRWCGSACPKILLTILEAAIAVHLSPAGQPGEWELKKIRSLVVIWPFFSGEVVETLRKWVNRNLGNSATMFQLRCHCKWCSFQRTGF